MIGRSFRGFAIAKRDRFALLLSGFVVMAFALVSCASTEPTPTIAPTPTVIAEPTVTPSPSPSPTPVPTATPGPTATTEIRARVFDIELKNLACIDFHPGVPNPDGPNHWYDVTASFASRADSFNEVQAIIEILDANGSSIIQVQADEKGVEAGQTVVFGEQIFLELQANDFTCRVTYWVEEDPPGVTGVSLADVESLYAP